MATKSLENPFAGYGAIVHGDRFIGREKELSVVRQRVLGRDYGNLAIIGLPRVGKSSLAWQAIMEKKEELENQKTIPLFFSAGHCSSAHEFFTQMVEQSYDEMKLVCAKKFEESIRPCLDSLLKQEYDTNCVQRYFRIVKRMGYKTIFILDEFDRAREIFDTPDFQLLRELSYNPDTRLCLVICSRKTINDIEVRNGAISNFSGTFSELRLRMFSEEDVDLYWRHFKNEQGPSDTYKSWAKYHSGCHPYLMDLINFEVFNTNNCLPSDSDVSFLSNSDEFKLKLIDALDNIVHTLEEEKLLNATLQLINGPLYDVKQEQIEKLLKYGVIRQVAPEYKDLLFNGMRIGPYWDDYAYLAFSDYSSWDLYRRYYADVPYFPVWGETENLLRSVVKGFLASQFPDDWENEFREYLIHNPPGDRFNLDKWKLNLDSLKSNQARMIEKFPERECRSLHLVDFTLTAQIFDIFIRPAKQWFGTYVFTGPWQEWNRKFDFLKKIRDPICHNNPMNLDVEKEIAKGYCAEISQAIRKWQKRIAKNNN